MLDRFQAVLNETQMIALGNYFGSTLPHAMVITLHGPIGAGKTTFVRACLQALGVTTPVNSPSYTLINPYVIGSLQISHMDFYRLEDPSECEQLGLDEHFSSERLAFVEWPENAAGYLPKPDLRIQIELSTDVQRSICIEAESERGLRVLRAIAEHQRDGSTL